MSVRLLVSSWTHTHWCGLGLLLLLGFAPVLCAEPGEAGTELGAESALRALEPIEAEYKAEKAKLDANLKALRESEEYKAARKERDYDKSRQLSRALTDPFREKWRARIQKAGERFEGAEGELVFASCLLKKRLAEDAGELVRSMVEAHAKSPELLRVAGNFGSLSRALEKDVSRAVLQRIIDETPLQEIAANAHYARATAVRYDRKASDEDKELAESDLAKIVELMPKDSLLSLKAQGPNFEKTRLQIGQEVPDIEGTDLAGVDFKLSDYRGKVIVLDFWGDW